MPNITRKWKKIVAFGCSHGIYADPLALEGVLRFIDNYKPHTRIHLGDFMDTTAFRSGAKGSSDESSPIPPDLEGGLDFIEKARITHLFAGNHEDRLYRLRHHHNAIVSHCANLVCNEIEDSAKKLRAEVVPYHIMSGWREIGGVHYGHGYMYNMLSCRDHAEMVGNCVFAHTHTTGSAKGRRLDNPTGYNVGTLSDIPNLDYAKARRATVGWAQGFVFGEYTDNKSMLWLHENGQNLTRDKWRLPV